MTLPPGWTSSDRESQRVSLSTGATCGFLLTPPGWEQLRRQREARGILEAPFAIVVETFPGAEDDVPRYGLANRDAQGWYIEGRAGAARADYSTIRDVHLLRAAVQVGVTVKHGYRGRDKTLMAVLYSDRTIVSLVAETAFRDVAAFTAILEGLEFE